MRIARPEMLWFLLLVPLVTFWLVWTLRRRRAGLVRFAGGALWTRLVHAGRGEVMVFKTVLVTLGITLVIIAAARPQWGTTLEQVSRKGIDVLIGIDISESMLAEDLKPNRLQKSLEEASRLLDRLDGDRVGLLAYAGSAGVLCPLTLDYNAVRIFLDAMEPDMISYPGTSLASAIRSGIEAFAVEERKFKVMVLFGDGEEQVSASEVEEAAGEAAEHGLIVHTIGTGTPQGAPIPVRTETGAISGYKKDRDGRVVTSRLDEMILRQISDMTGGEYFQASAAEAELDRIAEAIASMDEKEMQARLMTQYEERFQVPLALGLLCLLLDAFLTGRRYVRPPAAQPVAGRKEAA